MELAKYMPPDTLGDILVWETDAPNRKVAIVHNYLKGTESYLIVGCLLERAQKNKDWTKDGSEATTFPQWVENELSIKRTNAYRILDVWKKLKPFLPKHKDLILQIDFSKLVALASILTADEEMALEWFHRGTTNTVKDLEDNIRAHKGKIPTDECLHGECKDYVKCLICNKMFPA